MPVEYTVKEFAAKERVTERTVRQWLAKGALEFRRTGNGAGRGIRIIDRRERPRVSVRKMKIHEVSGSLST